MLEYYLNKKYDENELKNIREKYLNNLPFPNIMFKNFFNENFINDVANDFPDLKKKSSYKKDDLNVQNFFAFKEIHKSPEIIKNFLYFLNSYEFLNFLQKITGIKETLISDPYFYGSGLHQYYNGGYLKIHADYHSHPKLKLDRRLNLLIYLNKNWKEEYGGAIELWDKNMESCGVKVYPNINNVCIFSTDDKSFHGFPEPMNCPENVSRNSIAIYYYTNGRVNSDKMSAIKNTTHWKKRNNSEIVENNYNIYDYLRKFKILRKLKKIIFPLIKK